MPWMGFERTVPASARAKTVHALDRAATVTGVHHMYSSQFSKLQVLLHSKNHLQHPAETTRIILFLYIPIVVFGKYRTYWENIYCFCCSILYSFIYTSIYILIYKASLCRRESFSQSKSWKPQTDEMTTVFVVTNISHFHYLLIICEENNFLKFMSRSLEEIYRRLEGTYCLQLHCRIWRPQQ
jgi:hypothetical protein